MRKEFIGYFLSFPACDESFLALKMSIKWAVLSIDTAYFSIFFVDKQLVIYFCPQNISWNL